MSDPVKTKLSTLLEKATAIANGADKTGVLPDGEGYDATTAPDGAMRWCASILRIFLLRVIEHVLETRRGIAALMTVLRDPAMKEGENWRSDIPALREQVKEMSALMSEIVGAIRSGQGQAAPQEGPPTDAPANGVEKTAEEIEAATTQAQIDEMAKQLAKGESADLSKLVVETPTPPPSVVPIQGGKRNRNPAGNEKV